MQEKLGFKFFIVGDLKQSIYRFRGATMDAFNKMGCDRNEWKEYTLNINYRTDMRLLERFSKLFIYMGERELIPYNGEKDQLVGVVSNQLISSDELIEECAYSKEDEGDNFIKLFWENQAKKSRNRVKPIFC